MKKPVDLSHQTISHDLTKNQRFIESRLIISFDKRSNKNFITYRVIIS